MSESKKDTKANTPTRADGGTLPELVGRLGEDIMTLLDTKLNLVRVEIKEDVRVYTRFGMIMALGAVIATVGFALLNVAIAFFVSTLFQDTQLSQPVKYALGFTIISSVYLIIGSVVIIIAKNRLAKQTPVPDRSLQELEKDKQWMKREL
jgi:uncharacterized membrane protein YqjE